MAESDVRDVQLAVLHDQTVSELALEHPIHPGKEAFLPRRQDYVILWLLVTGKTIIVTGKMVPQLWEAIGEDSFIQPAQQFLVLQEQLEQTQLIHSFELFYAGDAGEIHETIDAVSHGDFSFDCFHAVQEPLLHFAVIDLYLFAFVS